MTVPRFKIGKMSASATYPEEAIKFIEELALSHNGGMIGVPCFRNVQVAEKDPHYAEIMNSTDMNIPDGMPLVWIGKLAGYKQIKQTNGPFIFSKILPHKESGIKHFLIGDTQETLDRVKNKYPDALMVGMISPPFCPVEDFDYESYAKQIKESQADIVWISMTAPKQDFFAERLKPLVSGKVLIGVGAAFRFVLGEYDEPPTIIRKLGLTGFIWRKWSVPFFIDYISASLLFTRIVFETLFSNKNANND